MYIFRQFWVLAGFYILYADDIEAADSRTAFI